MGKMAIVDVGSNSLRTVIYEINKDLTFNILDEDKRVIRLGEYLDEENYLVDEGVELAINELLGFKLLYEAYEVKDVYAVATEAIRKAKNKIEICERIKKEIEIDIRILTGEEEAYYGYFSIKNTIDKKNALLVDIGGSSLEITSMKNGEIKNSISLPLGSIVLSNKFIGEYKSERIDEFIYSELNKINWIKECSGLDIIGVGGTIRAIGKISRKRNEYPLNLSNNYKVNIEEVREICDLVSSLSIEERLEIKGIPKDRVDILPVPLKAIESIMKYCGSSNIIICEGGIREGLIYSNVLKDNEIDILDYSLKMIRNSIGLNNNRRNELIMILSNELHNSLGGSKEEKEIIKATAYLYDVGKIINSKSCHKNTFNLITAMGINGLSHEDIIKVAYTASLIWKEDFKLSKEYRKLIKEQHKQQCQSLASIVNIAFNIVRYLNEKIEEIDITCEGNWVSIKLPKYVCGYISRNITFDMKDNIRKSYNKVIMFVQ